MDRLKLPGETVMTYQFKQAGASAFAVLLVLSSVVGFIALFDPAPVGEARAQVQGDEIVFTASVDGSVKAVDASDQSTIWTYGGSSNPNGLSLGPDGDILYLGDEGSVKALHANNGSQIWSHGIGTDVIQVHISPSGDVVYGGDNNGVLHAIHTNNASEKWTYTGHSDWLLSISVSPDGNTVYSGGRGAAVHAVDASDASQLWTYSGHSDNIESLSAGPDGDTVYSGGADNSLRALNTGDGSLVWSAGVISGTVRGTAVSPDGGSVYSGESGDNNAVRKIDTDDGSEIWTFTGHSNSVEAVSISSDGEVVYSGSQDNTMKAIDSGSGTELWTYSGHSGDVVDVAASEWWEKPRSEIPVTVTDQNGDPLQSATVEIADDTGQVIDTGQTDGTGYYAAELSAGNYTFNVSKQGYRPVGREVEITEDGDNSQTFELVSLNESIELDTKQYLKHGQQADYTVTLENETGRFNVSAEANVTSQNESVVTVDQQALLIKATRDTAVNERTTLTAEITQNGNTYTAVTNVTVANATVENLKILPTWTKVTASLAGSDSDPESKALQVIIVATIIAAATAIAAGSFAGIAAHTLIMTAGWLIGYVGNGLVIVSFLFAIFVGLNVATNFQPIMNPRG